MNRRKIQNDWRLVCIFLFVPLICMLFGCGIKRQSKVDKVVTAEVLNRQSDSLLFRELCQSVRDKIVRVEHIRFDESDSLSPIPPLRSITRIAVEERVEQESTIAVEARSESTDLSYKEETLQKNQSSNVSSGKLFLIAGFLLLSVFIGRFLIRKASQK